VESDGGEYWTHRQLNRGGDSTELKPKKEMGMGVQFQRHLGEEAAGGRVLFPHYKKKRKKKKEFP
jgi:hypothetical protein